MAKRDKGELSPDALREYMATGRRYVAAGAALAKHIGGEWGLPVVLEFHGFLFGVAADGRSDPPRFLPFCVSMEHGGCIWHREEETDLLAAMVTMQDMLKLEDDHGDTERMGRRCGDRKAAR